MSALDRIIAAVTPPERQEARAKARAAASPGGWLEMVLDHHLEIEAAFARVTAGTSFAERRSAQKALALVLTRGAVAQHVYEEEGSRFLELCEKASAQTQDRLAERHTEEFQRYCGGADSAAFSPARAAPTMPTPTTGL